MVCSECPMCRVWIAKIAKIAYFYIAAPAAHAVFAEKIIGGTIKSFVPRIQGASSVNRILREPKPPLRPTRILIHIL